MAIDAVRRRHDREPAGSVHAVLARDPHLAVQRLGRRALVAASWAAVVADFDDALPADPSARPARCQLSDGSALRREWTVVTVSTTRAPVLAAWQVPVTAGTTPVYESVISTHRPAVVAAARVLVDAARAAGATPPASAVRLLDEPAPGPGTAPADVDRMWLRALARLDQPH